jgi:hypothetical protein
MHVGGSLEYQFAAGSSIEMMSNFASVASSHPVEAMAA